MSLLLAPYNNAMRLGQGFNSYTQQICVDDAVVADPNRAENEITNDGTTMRILAETLDKPSLWNRQPEVVKDNRAQIAIQKARAKAVEEAAKQQIDSKSQKSKQDSADKHEEKESDDPAAHPPEEIDKDHESGDGSEDSDSKIGGPSDKVEVPNPTGDDKDKSVSPAPDPKGKDKPKNDESDHKEKKEDPEESDEEDEIKKIKKEEAQRLAEQRAYRKELQHDKLEEQRAKRHEDMEDQKQIRKEKREYEAQRRQDNRKAIDEAAKAKKDALTLQDLEKIKAQNQFADRFVGVGENEEVYKFDANGPRGPSQTVTYSSRFVDKLSDVTDDMCVSGSLSIKAAKIGGSGRGSFVNSDKFKESDLNFYISVKVINQSINFKDALVYNPLRSVDKNNFQQVYGDSFISGFLEGGEFNAIVSMKIHNKAKLTDIKAEAKIAFTAGPVDIEAQANVGIARSNIETNTETTIQVSWCGGGHIKPIEQQWDIQSLMQAASRFPDLVADCPQRTYAILTKYDTLRSFNALKPAQFTPMQYENAQIYTNALMDSFMSYKALYKRLGEHIFNIQGKTLELITWEEVDKDKTDKKTEAKTVAAKGQKDSNTGLYPYKEDLSRFAASLKGLSDARTEIRRQMVRITNEVDLIEKDPKTATDEDHQEPFQSPVAFEGRLPEVKIPERLKPKRIPLSGQRIIPKPPTDAEQRILQQEEEEEANAPPLYSAGTDLTADETTVFDKIHSDRPELGRHLKVSSAACATPNGTLFNNLDFLQPEWTVTSILIEVHKGAVASVEVSYDNGLKLRKGRRSGEDTRIFELTDFEPGERIISSSIEYGKSKSTTDDFKILALRLYTNRGRNMQAQAANSRWASAQSVDKDGFSYDMVKTLYIDSPYQTGTVKGFFGRSYDTSANAGILRLGIIWGEVKEEKQESNSRISETPEKDISYTQISPLESGILTPPKWSPYTSEQKSSEVVKFKAPFNQVPDMLAGISHIEAQPSQPLRLYMGTSHVSSMGFESKTQNYGQSIEGKHQMCWLAFQKNHQHLESGIFDAHGVQISNGTLKGRVCFSRPFNKPPAVITWLYEMSYKSAEVISACPWSDANTTTENHFELTVGTLSSKPFDALRVGWFAFDKDATTVGSRVKTGWFSEQFVAGSKAITFEGEPFSRPPVVFFALNTIVEQPNHALHVHGSASDITTTGFKASAGFYNHDGGALKDTSTAWTWIAME